MSDPQTITDTAQLVKLFDGVVRFRPEVSIIANNNASGRNSYYAFVGYDAKGKTVRRSLGTDKDKAEAIKVEMNRWLADGDYKRAANVFRVATDLEITAATEKLRAYGATLPQAVDFFIKHHRPRAGHLTLALGVEKYLQDCERRKKTATYIQKANATYFKPFVKEFGGKRICDITQEDAEKYIFKTHANLSANSKGYHIDYLRNLFNAFDILGIAFKELNPFANIRKPEAGREMKLTKDIVLTVEDARLLLHTLYNEKDYDLCVLCSLVLFCGVRMQEVSKITWENIDFAERNYVVERAQAKRVMRRARTIPDNAYQWLLRGYTFAFDWPGRTKSGIDQRLKDIKNRLRKAVKEHPDDYPGCRGLYAQNGFRQSCAAYVYALYDWSDEEARKRLGHIQNAETFESNYKHLVKKQEAVKWFQILPPDSPEEIQLAARKRKEREERLAWEAENPNAPVF